MSRILKFILLFFFLFSNLYSALINDDGKSFSELLNDPYRGYNRGKDWGFPYKSDYSTTLLSSNIYVKFIGNEFVRIDNNYYRISQKSDFIFNLRHKTGSGYNLYDYSGNQSVFILQYYSGEFEQAKIKCWVNGNHVQTCGPGLSDAQDETFSYFNQWYIEYKATCDSSKNETFSKKLSGCVSCPSGQSWDDDGGKCFIDCTDKNKNKWGFPDGSCIDCSSSKNGDDVRKCYCSAIGSTWDPGVQLGQGDFFLGSCKDGSQFWYKNPGTPDIDDNKTKPDPNNPNPGGGSGGDSGGGSGGGNGGDSGGGNSGGSQDEPNPDPGNNDEFCKKNPNDPKCKKDDDFCKKNPKDPKCKKNDNNSTTPGPGGGNNNNSEPKFNPADFDYGDLKKDTDSFSNGYKKAIGSVLDGYDDFKNGVDQFISNIKGKGLTHVQKQEIPKTCARRYDIDFFGYHTVLEFDFCKVVAPASTAFYYLFYIFFFGCFLMFIFKLLVFAM